MHPIGGMFEADETNFRNVNESFDSTGDFNERAVILGSRDDTVNDVSNLVFLYPESFRLNPLGGEETTTRNNDIAFFWLKLGDKEFELLSNHRTRVRDRFGIELADRAKSRLALHADP